MDRIYRKIINEYFDKKNIPTELKASLNVEHLSKPCIGIICSFTGIGILQSTLYKTLTNWKNRKANNIDEYAMDAVQFAARLKTMHRQMAELGLVVVYLVDRIQHDILNNTCSRSMLHTVTYSPDLPALLHVKQWLKEQFNCKIYTNINDASSEEEIISVVQKHNK